jgi:predicted enzyme related to lactoylglutathione lyase
MRLQRPQLLRILSGAFGSTFIINRNQSAFAQPTGEPARGKKEATTERVTGIGGLFFRAHDPKALTKWYEEHLGITANPAWQQEAGPTAFTPFPETTKYFGDLEKHWMVNFRVGDLDKMVAQLQAAGIEVKVDPETYPYGFARIHDPEGNPVELWQPK